MTLLLSLIACGKVDQGNCEVYIDCSEAVGLPTAGLISSYGPNGSCWSEDADSMALCRSECDDGIAILVEGDGKGLPECEATQEPAGDNPRVPEDLWDSWQYEVESACDEGDTIVFVYGEGASDADGNFTATETWYWFDDTPLEYDDDAVDILTFVGTPMSVSDINSFVGSEPEEGYDTIRNAEQNESGANYGDDTDVRYIFDTLTPNGTLNFENRMLVWRAMETSKGWDVKEHGVTGKSFFFPESDVLLAPPATYVWEARRCY